MTRKSSSGILANVLAVLCAISLIVPQNPSFAADGDNPGYRNWNVGLKLGMVFPETSVEAFSADGYELDLGSLTGIFADYSPIRYFSFGAFLTFLYLDLASPDRLRQDAGLCYLGFGLRLRGRIPIGAIEVRPGASLGWAYTPCGTDMWFDPSDNSGPHVGASIEISYSLTDYLGLLADVGIVWHLGEGKDVQDIGGGETAIFDFTINLEPAIQLSVGIEFGGE